jgi:Cu(I)/Ag(I) efflux system membrane fusion protein
MKSLIKTVLTLLVIVSIGIGAYWLYQHKSHWFTALQEQISSYVSQQRNPQTALEHAQQHTDPHYVCPIHSKMSQKEPGNCPICGISFVKWKPPTHASSTPEAEAKPETALEHALKHADPNYVCPMHPQISQKEPGNCPICGMDLVLKASSATDISKDTDTYPEISIDPTTAQNMGIRTYKVKTDSYAKTIKTVGNITYNEDKVQHIHARSSGWVEILKVRAEGDAVNKGDLLFEYYSPELLAAQKDFLLTLKSGQLMSDKSRQSLINTARNKLSLLGVPAASIKRIQNTGDTINRIPVYATQSGVVSKMNIQDGMYITPEMELFTITDLSTVWLLADVFEHEITHIKQGAVADIQIDALGKQTITGNIDYIYPELAPQTRTLQVRITLNNESRQLKPNMFATVTLQGEHRQGLFIPSEALIPTSQETRVVRLDKENNYQPIAVKTGLQVEGMTEVLDGLQADDEIIISGQFLIDSESNLQASFRRMTK